jgi:hypothetical protein
VNPFRGHDPIEKHAEDRGRIAIEHEDNLVAAAPR